MKWNNLPWRRCRAVLEKQGDSAYFGRCDRNRKHQGLHALERGFDVVWFETRTIDMNQEWQPLRDYARADVEMTLAIFQEFKPCGCKECYGH